MEKTSDISRLTFEELTLLNEQKGALKKEHSDYLAQHPELQTMLATFVCSVLVKKPKDIIRYAQQHFCLLQPVTTGNNMSMTTSILDPLVIAGPSGVGKGTLINKLLEQYPTLFGFSVSHTTRGPRPGEVEGISYHFTTRNIIEEEIKNNLFLEHADVHGNIYGTSKQALEKVKSENKICVLDIDIQGVQQVKKSGVVAKYIFISPPAIEELERRLRGRHTETEEKIQLRLKNAKGEMDYAALPGHFDKIVVNDDLDNAYKELKTTLKSWYPQLKDI